VAVPVFGELEVPSLAMHPEREVTDATPGVKPAVEGIERRVVGVWSAE
jgi:hypothetical protein